MVFKKFLQGVSGALRRGFGNIKAGSHNVKKLLAKATPYVHAASDIFRTITPFISGVEQLDKADKRGFGDKVKDEMRKMDGEQFTKFIEELGRSKYMKKKSPETQRVEVEEAAIEPDEYGEYNV